ncbi:MAG: hypothetical protein METHAR1v1_1500007 [Methanothrix sp.]|nr:MAG: hypothetical protein METHAR1v1_1500007 [Methanothrix sp.]
MEGWGDMRIGRKDGAEAAYSTLPGGRVIYTAPDGGGQEGAPHPLGTYGPAASTLEEVDLPGVFLDIILDGGRKLRREADHLFVTPPISSPAVHSSPSPDSSSPQPDSPAVVIEVGGSRSQEVFYGAARLQEEPEHHLIALGSQSGEETLPLLR